MQTSESAKKGIPTYKSILLILRLNDLNGNCRRYGELPALAYKIHKKFPDVFADAVFEEISGTIDSLDLERALRLLEANEYIRIVWREKPRPGSYISLTEEGRKKALELLKDVGETLKQQIESYIKEAIEKDPNWIWEANKEFQEEQLQLLRKALALT